MTTNLLKLKTDSQRATNRLERYRSFRAKMSTLTLWSMAPLFFIGVLLMLASSATKTPAPTGSFLLAASALATAIWAFSTFLPGKEDQLMDKRDKATDAYRAALHAEMVEYGIDPESVSSWTSEHAPVFEFTARRHGVTADISVREIGNELAFVMKGERLKKRVSF